MEVENCYDLLHEEWHPENSAKILPQIRKCILESQCEKEVLRALELVFNFYLKNITEVEVELFESACLESKKIVEERLKSIEKNPANCVECLNVTLQIISFFQRVFEALNEQLRVKVVEVKSFLIITSEVVYCCLYHCKMSEQIYGSLLGSLAEHLSNFFKKSCVFLEHLLSFLTRNAECDCDDESEIMLFDKIMTYLSKSGIILINLEIKTMAKVWKSFAFLLENHPCFRKIYNIDETLKGLCCSVITNMEGLDEGGQDFEKVIKLNCFLLKVIMKICNFYSGTLKSCHNSLLNLLLMLCRWDTFVKTQPKFNSKEFQDLLNQLTIGSEPLLSLLIKDELFAREVHKVHKSFKSFELAVLCCLILKKLIDCNSAVRSLWFNKEENILMWVFSSASSSELVITRLSLPNIIINGKQTKFTDLYEYVLVTTSAFLMTATTDEYELVERILIENVLQTQPIRALLAIDIWCLLARFADSELCFCQILTLGKLLQEILGTCRIEKWYLMSLIKRLFLLLSESHKETFLTSFPTTFYSALWEECCFNGFSSTESSHIRKCVLSQIHHVLDVNEKGTSERDISKFWKFNCDVLVSSFENEKFFKILCGLTASVVSELPQEDLFLVLTQVKKLLTMGQSTCTQLYFTQLLKSLSTVFFPPGTYQGRIITTIADLFRILLSSQQVLVKQKALETFYTFSHITSHGDIISLSVQDAPDLKLEITNYFKKTPPDKTHFNLDDYFSELFKKKFVHSCPKLEAVEKREFGSVDLNKIVMRWKEDGEQIIECFQMLSESEKIQVNNVCQSILCLLDKRK